MKILLDHNLDRRLAPYLADHHTSTTQQQGWADVLNGELLALAEEKGFEVLLTADANLKTQQNLANSKIGVLVLRAYNNRLKTHVEMIKDVETALSSLRLGEVVEIFHKDFREKQSD